MLWNKAQDKNKLVVRVLCTVDSLDHCAVQKLKIPVTWETELSTFLSNMAQPVFLVK